MGTKAMLEDRNNNSKMSKSRVRVRPLDDDDEDFCEVESDAPPTKIVILWDLLKVSKTAA